MYTLDTNIIIYFLKGQSEIVKLLQNKIYQSAHFFISTITEAELLSYPEMTSDELAKIDNILKTLSIIPVDSQIARLSGFFKRKYNISLPDAIIAATGYLTNSTILTKNIKDFKNIQEITIESV